MLKILKFLIIALFLSSGMLQGMNTAQTEAKQKATATAELHDLIENLAQDQEDNPEILKKVQELLDQGADPNPQSFDEMIPLITLIETHNCIVSTPLIALLIKGKANPSLIGCGYKDVDSADKCLLRELEAAENNNSYTDEEKKFVIESLRELKEIFDTYSPAPQAPPAPRPVGPSVSSADQKAEASMKAGDTPQTPATEPSAAASTSAAGSCPAGKE